MSTALITARKPVDVAREIELLLEGGCDSFVVRSIDHGGMLDLERLGAARYTAGLDLCVVLEEEVEEDQEVVAPAAAAVR